jgi:hypothetical protein
MVEIPACTEPHRHRSQKPDSELVIAASDRSEADHTEALDRRERRYNTENRTTWVDERLHTGQPPATTDAFPPA